MEDQSANRRLKVYTGRHGRCGRLLVAASSWAEVARLSGRSMYELRNYWSITSNQTDIALAMKQPRVPVVIEEDV